MLDPKIRKKIDSLQRLIDHPSTGDGERAAAQGRLDALKSKYKVTDPPPRPKRGPSTTRTWQDENVEDWIKRNFAEKTEAQQQADRIRRQQEQYEAWQRANEAMVKKMAADKAREVRQREERERAQKAWEERNRNRDSRGVPLTEEEKRQAREDPLGWAIKQDGRTADEKNADMQRARSTRHIDDLQ